MPTHHQSNGDRIPPVQCWPHGAAAGDASRSPQRSAAFSRCGHRRAAFSGSMLACSAWLGSLNPKSTWMMAVGGCVEAFIAHRGVGGDLVDQMVDAPLRPLHGHKLHVEILTQVQLLLGGLDTPERVQVIQSGASMQTTIGAPVVPPAKGGQRIHVIQIFEAPPYASRSFKVCFVASSDHWHIVRIRSDAQQRRERQQHALGINHCTPMKVSGGSQCIVAQNTKTIVAPQFAGLCPPTSRHKAVNMRVL